MKTRKTPYILKTEIPTEPLPPANMIWGFRIVQPLIKGKSPEEIAKWMYDRAGNLPDTGDTSVQRHINPYQQQLAQLILAVQCNQQDEDRASD